MARSNIAFDAFGSTADAEEAETTPMFEPSPPVEPSILDGNRLFNVRTLSWQQECVAFLSALHNYAEAGSRLHRRYGDVVRMRVPVPMLHLDHPRHLHHVLRGNVLNYPKTENYKYLRPLLGNGLFLSDGEFWTRQRRLVAPEFRPKAVERFLPVIIKNAEAIFVEWERSGPHAVRNIADDMMRFTLWVVGDAMFRSDFRAEAEEIGHTLEVCLQQATLQMLLAGWPRPWMPTPGNRRARKAEQRLNAVVRKVIAHGRATGGGQADVLSRLLVAEDEQTGAKMDDQQVLDEVKSLVLAGHETTSLALSWTFYLLSQHPAVEARIVNEVRSVLGTRPPTTEDVPRLEYTKMVLLEAMRLYPPVPGVPRVAQADDFFDGIKVFAGEQISLNIYATHRHPEFWERPDSFDPERFSEARSGSIAPYSYLPFLIGRRACLGEHFAMLEGVVALAMMVGRYHAERVDTGTIATRPISTLRLARPLHVRVRRR